MINSNPTSQSPPKQSDGLVLRGLDGANPLGFLAALGTLQTLMTVDNCQRIHMSWIDDSLCYHPRIHGLGNDTASLATKIANHLNCPFDPDPTADAVRKSASDGFGMARRAVQKAEDELKHRRLRGEKREAAERRELEPLREKTRVARDAWLKSLAQCVPSLELSLGKHLNATCAELRDAMLNALSDSNAHNREILDLLASFGSDACSVSKGLQMQPTPFCFTTGSGHQFFLNTVRQLTTHLNANRLEIALFKQTLPQDETLSMRWDPVEDRRYAHMWSDPQAPDNVAKTNWAMNLLGYRGLTLLPSAPTARGLKTTGWSSAQNGDQVWTWPIWKGEATASVIRSLLALPSLLLEKPDVQQTNHLGIRAAYRSSRIQVGNPPHHKVNFTPAQRIV